MNPFLAAIGLMLGTFIVMVIFLMVFDFAPHETTKKDKAPKHKKGGLRK